MRRLVPGWILLMGGAVCAWAQAPVDIQVDLQRHLGTFVPTYRWFGYDESNYTTTRNGQALLRELHELTPEPVYVRAHFLLATGNGKPELKWSSSNVYTEDAAGKPVYDWKILDGIFDAWVGARVRPYVELGFMPQALSSHPDPYHIPWPTRPGEAEGWSYPPKDYARWRELVHHVATHMVARYGMAEVTTWYWEVWNEPDIFYWHGTAEEYDRLYDNAVAGVRAAIPTARVGGPATTGPTPGSRSGKFLEGFLRHCALDRSSATGGAIPLDFISFHVKGSPHVMDGHAQMGLGRELQNAQTGFEIVRASAKFRNLPIVLSEADPEGCGACSPEQHPEDAYRNGTVYPAYTAAEMKGLGELAAQQHANLIGFLTWAFEFEGQPLFAGRRSLASHGIDKPELNFFRMAGMLGGERVTATSTGAIAADDVVKAGVRERPEIDAIATAARDGASVLVWNYHDALTPGEDVPVWVTLRGVPAATRRILLEEYRIDGEHSNAFEAWKRMGSPAEPSEEQMAALKAAGQLQTTGSPRWVAVERGQAVVEMTLPWESVSLLRVGW
ncbi:MAG TPA: beta-xylosidase [Acidobacteriaceae bacterium]|nr:beta-xylosidase [Acidobacteriaceae bacterium]